VDLNGVGGDDGGANGLDLHGLPQQKPDVAGTGVEERQTTALPAARGEEERDGSCSRSDWPMGNPSRKMGAEHTR
jgi:hypothetical protein